MKRLNRSCSGYLKRDKEFIKHLGDTYFTRRSITDIINDYKTNFKLKKIQMEINCRYREFRMSYRRTHVIIYQKPRSVTEGILSYFGLCLRMTYSCGCGERLSCRYNDRVLSLSCNLTTSPNCLLIIPLSNSVRGV